MSLKTRAKTLSHCCTSLIHDPKEAFTTPYISTPYLLDYIYRRVGASFEVWQRFYHIDFSFCFHATIKFQESISVSTYIHNVYFLVRMAGIVQVEHSNLSIIQCNIALVLRFQKMS